METDNQEYMAATIVEKRKPKSHKAYRGLRKPRSNNVELWAIYNEVHGKGVREQRVRHTQNQAAMIRGLTDTIE